MPTTWNEIRAITLQKMFLIDDDQVVENDSTRSYLAAMPGAYNEAIRLISTNNRYIVKSFDIEANIGENVINLKESVPDMYQLKPNGIYFKSEYGEEMNGYYGESMIGDDFLILNAPQKGTFLLYYYAYPIKVTDDTKGDVDLQIDDDVASLIPLYMASQLYKDDEIGIATIYRNEFEVGRELLTAERNGSVAAKFVNKTGWW